MRPIRDISEVHPDSVLYHSAFGFARVTNVRDAGVDLAWEKLGENMPARVSLSNLTRVYALCHERGFFHRALLAKEDLQEFLLFDPPGALEILLEDLVGPQRRQDLRDWITGRDLMTEPVFDRWWETLEPQLAEDERFIYEQDAWSLARKEQPTTAVDRLANPLLSPGRRLDLALIHRAELGDRAFRDHALRAWCTGGKQVRDLALAALRDTHPDDIFLGLLEQGPESIDAIIHAIRQGGWQHDDVAPKVRLALVQRVLDGSRQGGPLDSEGRLAASLSRWGAPEAAPALATVLAEPDGQQLLRATLATLPPKRSEGLAFDVLAAALLSDEDELGIQWLGGEILVRSGDHQEGLATRLDELYPVLGTWYRESYDPTLTEDLLEDGFTAEVEIAVTEPIALIERRPRTHREFMALGLALARGLAQQHNAGVVVNPTRDHTLVLPDGSIELHPSSPEARSPRPLGEQPGQSADVHAAAVLLLEAMLGVTWPRNIPAHRCLPFLRAAAPYLPPSALAPLDVALHPIGDRRPADGLAWLVRWQAAAVSEDTRLDTAQSDQHRLRIGFDSHVGKLKLLHTQVNQDALFVSARGPLHLMVVCDGISTATAGSGDVASGITVHVVANLWEQALPRLADANDSEIFDFIDRALRMANQAVCEAALRFAGGQLDGRVPMGTTAVVAIARGNRVCLGTLGDSRAYLVGPYGAALLTADQNQAAERLVGWVHGIDPYWDPAGFALIGYVGHFNEWNRPEALPVHHVAVTLLQGERLVLCSDGVTDYLADTHPELCDMLRDLVKGDDPDEIARHLINQANRGGGGDNATAIVTGLWRPS